MIDWDRVIELRNEVGSDDFDEVVDLFLNEVDEVIERLRAGSDRSQLESDLHFLKGSCLNLGFATFSTLCQRGESMAASGMASDVNVEDMLDVYEKSRSTFIEKSSHYLSS
ncbi:Hpt domain-containing protein [Pacificibacter maritimus]|uniref:Hpt domain-containing protein n=1 Tax=Pacificibacter maritimus TaxID=762213 RepID=A0A3N4UC09_9RHOB|nr:Hpt domain-containing protein [Pacificibacter maritimus]RPE64701.1 Hpt domain-containing protein [Pacificibacter maritimus]